MSSVKQGRLSNGLDVFYRSRADLDMLEDEMFDDNQYCRNGIELRNGDCIFDAGANIGFFLIYLNQTLSDASVFCFEPIPETFELLEQNAKRHNHLNLRIENCGLSNQSGVANFKHYPHSSVSSTMYPQDSKEFLSNSRRYILDEIRKRGRVLRLMVDWSPSFVWTPLTELIRRRYQSGVNVESKLRTVSEVIDEHDVTAIDLLKVDTEGAELSVLQGIRDEHWPLIRQAVVEVHDGVCGLEKVLAILESFGFSLVVDEPSETLSHLRMVYATRRAV